MYVGPEPALRLSLANIKREITTTFLCVFEADFKNLEVNYVCLSV